MSTFLKKELEENNFIVNEITEGILLIDNFISKNELTLFWEIINNTNEKEWHYLYLEGLKTFCMEKFQRDDVENLVAEGKFEITDGWEDKNLKIDEYEITRKIYHRLNDLIIKADKSLFLNNLSFQRMQPNVELKSHTDQHTDPSIKYAAIFYLNDDYKDGEVFFKNKNIELRPKPGSLLVFPGNDEFEHGVKHVGNGPIRYVIPSFVKIKDFYKDNKY